MVADKYKSYFRVLALAMNSQNGVPSRVPIEVLISGDFPHESSLLDNSCVSEDSGSPHIFCSCEFLGGFYNFRARSSHTRFANIAAEFGRLGISTFWMCSAGDAEIESVFSHPVSFRGGKGPQIWGFDLNSMKSLHFDCVSGAVISFFPEN